MDGFRSFTQSLQANAKAMTTSFQVRSNSLFICDPFDVINQAIDFFIK
jgi:hypothetical protein